MKVYILESIYFKKVNNENNWITAIFLNKNNAEKMKIDIEKRSDIKSCHIFEFNVNDSDISCEKCKSEMELQFVCENCGKREPI